jgi:hypothetical protein
MRAVVAAAIYCIQIRELLRSCAKLRLRPIHPLSLLTFTLGLFFPSAALAQDATWSSGPTVPGPIGGMFEYNSAANGNPTTVPTGTATFGATSDPNLCATHRV